LTVEPFSRARPCVALAAAFLACFPAAALAWNAAGHRLIAAIAWNGMSSEAREEAGALLRRHPDYPRWLKKAGKKSADRGDRDDRGVFVEASTWPDDIRGDKRFYSAGKGPPTPVQPGFADMERWSDWHYVNIPLSGAFGGKPFSGRLDRQLPELARTLAQSRSPRAHAYALPWLIHLAGDAHQPLHASARVDAAGKRDRSEHTRKLRNPFNPRKPLATPHVFWDDLPGARLRGERLEAAARALAALYAQVDRSTASRRWIEESWQLARDHAYPPAGGNAAEITAAFYRDSQEITGRRIAQAGFRLAGVLNLSLAANERAAAGADQR
jgi:hypothetical protein